MKKFVSIMVMMSLLFTMFAAVGHAAEPPPSPKLFLNEKPIVTDVAPKIENGSTYVPLAVLSDGLGYVVEWEQAKQKVTVKNESKLIELVIGEKQIKVNDVIMETTVAPKLVNWRTMVPVRLVGELLGLTFEWKDTEREVHMFSESYVPGTEQPQEPGTSEPDGSEQAGQIGYITGIAMDGQSVLTVTHQGVQKPGKPLLLDNPKRLVFDFQNTTFNPATKGETVVSVADNALLTGYKYAQFQTNPFVARLVILVGDETGYVLTETENAFHFALMPKSEVPAEPATPADPNQPDPEDEVYDIVIDAGHGAKDPGAYSKSINRWEKEFNLLAALALKAELEKDKRFRVHMTRVDDTFLELTDRIKFAEDRKADLFISLHANSFDKTSVNGSETYYYRDNSKPLADHLHKYVLKGLGLNDRGVKKAAYKVIKETTMPAVLIEAGYLSNSTDAKTIFNANVQKNFAVQLTEGIKSYFKLK
ncbi:N-acetylmuramoyl-L-alanine amidase family protein [Paenibacillus soyae]|uniref:N-acetylmuramoyl-L-alanine amidase family protein n=1 Tax=Paenibacillus soyae TaxID=2969249 RepID=A0A9X2MNH5_9BACL|nr:N-acetylmuramoyl-L-alanine amidase family protein [Paenibacillus soyae]MCR2802953.1 N-acetylmuramoyl-L-alanine amidase family protein [Paenibacillus soyae]